jgi:deoxyribodipyrimidine photo-lyase
MRALMWFRSDLRVVDNTALHRACKAADDGVVGVFAICGKQWAEHDWGSMKVDFVLRNVAALSDALARLNIPLCIIKADRFAQIPKKLIDIAKRHECNALYYNKEHEVNELRRDEEVRSMFEKHGREVHAFTDQTIAEVEGIRTNSDGHYTVFTPFKRKWCEALKDEGVPSQWPKPRKQASLGIEADDVPDSLTGFKGHRRPDLWPEGEAAAKKKLRAFVSKRIDKYDKDRDRPATNGTSTLSPYLAAGVLSPRQCLHAALDVNNGRLDSGKKGVTTWISELVWREFYRHILIGFPRVCKGRPFKLETDELPWREDDELFTAWCEGRTGYPIVDAGMRQLAQTGWMHNRVRMIVAMFLTKDLFIDWRWGERFFMQSLVDGDFASNNGGWQWSASTGTDAAPYFRIFNPISQSKRYDPAAKYIHRFLPELVDVPADMLHRPREKWDVEVDYPDPIVDHAKARQMVLDAFGKKRQ